MNLSHRNIAFVLTSSNFPVSLFHTLDFKSLTHLTLLPKSLFLPYFSADRLNSARVKADRLWQNHTALGLGPGHHVGL